MINKKDSNDLDKNFKKGNFLKIIKGSIISIIFSLILLLVLAALLTFTNMPEGSMAVAIIIISAISILIGSIFSSMNIKKNGLINGGLVGLIYIAFIYILSSVLFVGFYVNFKTVIVILASILAGMIGGIVGVNIHKR